MVVYVTQKRRTYVCMWVGMNARDMEESERCILCARKDASALCVSD